MAQRTSRLLVAAAIGFSPVWISPAQAQLCVKRSDLVPHLASKYGEVTIGEGLTENGGLVEVAATENGSTWTLFVSFADGRACLLASGRDWQGIRFQKPGQPS